MQEETKLVYKNFWFFISIAVILLFISLFAYLDILQKNLKAEMSQNIMEIAEMEANSFNTKIKEETQTVNALAGIMEKYYAITDLDTFIDILDQENNNNDFIYMGIIMQNGDVYFNDHSLVKDFLPQEALDNIFEGNSITTGPLDNPYDEKDLIITAARHCLLYTNIRIRRILTFPKFLRNNFRYARRRWLLAACRKRIPAQR